MNTFKQCLRASRYDVVVVSYGGVGTTFFLEYLSRFLKTNHPDDHDGFKHMGIPPLYFKRTIKFIYLHGNPELAVMSLFRRSYQCRQSKKLLKYADKKVASVQKGIFLEDYAAAGVDRFQFETHFDNWFNRYLYRDTLFIKYESIFENLDKISQFLNLNDDFLKNFPEKRIRHTLNDEISIATNNQLNRMYESFTKKLDTIDDICLKKPKKKHIFPKLSLIKRHLIQK